MYGGRKQIRVGEAKVREALHPAIRQVCASANVSPNRIRAICVGGAGAARPEIADKIRGILAAIIPDVAPARVEIVGDHEIALEAAFGAGPGVIAIAGTGSIVYGRDARGRIARAGGWGFAISAEGSGHWIDPPSTSALMTAR